MSFTINQFSDPTIVKPLTTAINQAVLNGILIFCSASDQGPQDSGAYLASCNQTNSFLINTAANFGRTRKWNGTNKLNYILPGIVLELAGDSVGVGLAALIMDCVALRDAAEFESIKHGAHSKMKMAFDSVNTRRCDNPDDNKYLRVWDTFRKVVNDHGKDDKGSSSS
ncbi:hypothetical protein GGR51DRAFT_559110 [Nemania sp. FL0031]|nr:hypothetical protein GGR51DRAFT_559110 [Nemania sp. FL0031]